MTRYIWNQMPDISVYELAAALNVLLPSTGGGINADDVAKLVEGLPVTVRRHFTAIT